MEKYFVGQSAKFGKTITESDIYSFAGICGDFNSVHINKEAAKESIFGKQVAHGMLTASFISTVLGMILPGQGTIYLSQNLTFKKPVFIGDTIYAEVRILEIFSDGKARLDTIVQNQNGENVITGDAIVILPSK